MVGGVDWVGGADGGFREGEEKVEGGLVRGPWG